MRVATVRLNVDMFQHIFRPNPEAVIFSDWPPDARVLNATWDFYKREVALSVLSDEFDDVADGNIAPEWSPTFRVRDIPRSLIDLFEAYEKEALQGD